MHGKCALAQWELSEIHSSIRATRLHDARDGRRSGAHTVVRPSKRFDLHDQVARADAQRARALRRALPDPERGSRRARVCVRRRETLERGRERVRRAPYLLGRKAARPFHPCRVAAYQDARAVLRSSLMFTQALTV